MLRRVLDRLQHRTSSVQYELQRRTYRGGWKNYYREIESSESTAFDTPPAPPEFTDSANNPPGAYRCIQRVDGRIASVVWERDSPNADAYYQEQWRKTRQRERLEEMSADEIWRELEQGAAFDALSQRDVVEAAVTKAGGQDAANTGEDETDSSLRDELVRAVAEEKGPQAAMNQLKEVIRAENGLCAYCLTEACEHCSSCGELVCRQHFNSYQGICSTCQTN